MLINLNNWSINLPTGNTKYPIEYGPYVTQDKYGLTLKTPCDGKPTKNSKFPRTELREMINTKKAKWASTEGTHKFKGVYSVNRFTFIKPEICIFQIHDGSKDVLQIIATPTHIKYKYNDIKITLGPYNINERFKIKCKVYRGSIELKYNFNFPILLPIDSLSLYFKTGNYLQSNDIIEVDPDEYSLVTIHELGLKHFID